MHLNFLRIPLFLILLGLFSSATAQEVERTGNIFYKAVCGFVVGHAARCHSHVITNSSGRAISNKQTPIGGYGPSDLRDAYKVTATGAASTIIAIVDAYGYTNAETDLNTYRKYFGLPACTQKNGCFKKFNQSGKQKDYPPQDNRWAGESALDLDMASAMCPNCVLYLVEANSSSISDLAAAVNTSAKLGARAISNSYGGDEAGSQTYESAYNHQGTAITASSGDSGYAGGVQFPASSPHLTAVGGTYLVRDGSARGWNEKVWSGAGSGCSSIYSKPSWQHDSGCSNRTVADVSAVASDLSPVAVYGPDKDTGQSQWEQWSGTSVAAPIIAGIYAANGGKAKYGSDPYKIRSTMFDVTSGSNGTCSPKYLCHGQNGYDGPSGLGTPNGTLGVDQSMRLNLLYSFQGGSDGAYPSGGVITDGAGNLYGVAAGGGSGLGTNGDGVVFRLAPDGTETVLHSFTGSDGANPIGGVIMDREGNLYGTTAEGGRRNDGVVFKLSPGGTETVLHSFTGRDGSYPNGVIMDGQGNLYGTTNQGGGSNVGTLFRLALDGTETVLHSFGGSDGAYPIGGVIIDDDGDLYGTTSEGGEGGCARGGGCGTVFKLAPDGTETVLYFFQGGSDGYDPRAAVIADGQGVLYGTTTWGGGNDEGMVFKLASDGKKTVLHSFSGSDGDFPSANLILDSEGNLYSTTQGIIGGDSGSVFKLASSGAVTTLYSFNGSDGAHPSGGVIMDGAGNFYGATGGVGTDYGTVFKLTPR